MTTTQQAMWARDTLNEALADAREILFKAECEALEMLAPYPMDGPGVEALLEEIQDMMGRRLAGETGREPVRFEAWELVAAVERATGKHVDS